MRFGGVNSQHFVAVSAQTHKFMGTISWTLHPGRNPIRNMIYELHRWNTINSYFSSYINMNLVYLILLHYFSVITASILLYLWEISAWIVPCGQSTSILTWHRRRRYTVSHFRCLFIIPSLFPPLFPCLGLFYLINRKIKSPSSNWAIFKLYATYNILATGKITRGSTA